MTKVNTLTRQIEAERAARLALAAAKRMARLTGLRKAGRPNV